MHASRHSEKKGKEKQNKQPLHFLIVDVNL